MGWNRGYTIYEHTVISVYNTGFLTPELLRILIEPYRDTDIDHGGCMDLTTTDGMTADEVVLKILAPDFWQEYEAADRDHPEFLSTWTKIMGVG